MTAADDIRSEPVVPNMSRRAALHRWIAPGHVSFLAVVAIAVIVAGIQLWWISTFRDFGNMNGDEARYAALAFQLRDSLSGSPQITVPWFGPVVPALSTVMLLMGPTGATTVMAVQPIMLIVLAVSTWGVARRVASLTVATVAGALVVVLPGVVAATQTYLLVLGAAAVLMCSIWALLESDSGTNGWIWAHGALVWSMVLTRGQTIVFAPVIVLAALWYCRGNRDGLRRLVIVTIAGAGVVTVYLSTNRAMLQYLIGGMDMPTAESFASRISFRAHDLISGLTYGAAIVLCGITVAVIATGLVGRDLRIRMRSRAIERGLDRRGLIALSVVVAGSLSMMLVSPNQGDYGMFDVPLLAPLLVLLLTVISLTPRTIAAGAYALVALAVLMAFARTISVVPQNWIAFGTQNGTYSLTLMQAAHGHDPRFETLDRSNIQQATREWWSFALSLDETLRYLDGRTTNGAEFFYEGSGMAYGVFTGELVAAMQGVPRLDYRAFPLGEAEPDELRQALLPDDRSKERILVVPRIRNDPTGGTYTRTEDDLLRELEQDDYRAQTALYELALSEGWEPTIRLPMPLGDEMLVMEAPRR